MKTLSILSAGLFLLFAFGSVNAAPSAEQTACGYTATASYCTIGRVTTYCSLGDQLGHTAAEIAKMEVDCDSVDAENDDDESESDR